MEPEAPLYERDPAAWHSYLAEGNAKQARKRVGADVLIRDEHGCVLLVNPSYKPDWDLPGGMAETNESPAAAARREIKEELGLDLKIGPLLVVDWVPAHGPWDDSLMFIFDGGTMTSDQARGLQVLDEELAGLRFVKPAEACRLLRPYMWERVRAALDLLGGEHAAYREYGKRPSSA
ncbi:NUDIX domain-containing protein [Nonomuraea sp. NPDC003201]